MAAFDESEMINSAEYQEDPDLATLKFLKGGYSRLVTTTANLTDRVGSVESTMVAIERTLLQISNQLGKRPIVAESSHRIPPVTHSDTYVRDDLNRLPMDNRKSLLRKIEMPKFDGTNAYDWLSKVERFFRVGRYSDLDKLDLVAFSLDGDVLRWFNWEVNRREFHSWEEFRQRLFRRFGAAPEDSPGNRLLAIKQKETVSAYVTGLAELSAQVIEQQPVHKEESITLLQVPVSNLEHSLQFHTESPNVCGNYQDVVGCDALGKEENLFSVLSQASQVWEPGGVLKLKAPVGLENQKKSRCLKASLFNFKRKHKRIKRSHSQQQQQQLRRKFTKSWSFKYKGIEDIAQVTLVSGFVGFNLSYFRCHKEYGFARMINWSQVRVECSLLQGILFCQNSLSSSQFKFKHGLETSDGIRDGDIAKLVNLTGDKLQLTSLEGAMVVFKIHHRLRNTRFQSREMKQLVGFMKFQLKHKWRSKHLHTSSALELYLSSVFSTVPSATSGRLQGLLEQVLQKDDEAYPQILDKLQLNLKQGMDVHGASGLRLFLCQQKFSSIWHRWRRKDSDLEVQLKERALVQSSVSPELLDEAVWIPEVGCRELLVKWQDHDASENFWMFSKDFVQLYPSSKLEDKLVFEGGSIDTIKQSYDRRRSLGLKQRVSVAKKLWKETEGLPFRWKSEKFI